MKIRRERSIYLPKRTFMQGLATADHVVLGYALGSIVALRRSDYSIAWDMPAKRWRIEGARHGVLVLGNHHQDLTRGTDPETGATLWVREGAARFASGGLFLEEEGGRLTELDPLTGRKVDEWSLPASTQARVAGRTVLLWWPDAPDRMAFYDLDAREIVWQRQRLSSPSEDSARSSGRGTWRHEDVVVEQAGAAFRGTILGSSGKGWVWQAPGDVGQAYCVAGYIVMHLGSQLLALDAHTGEIAWLRDLGDLKAPLNPPTAEWSGGLVVVGRDFSLTILEARSGASLASYSKTPNFVSMYPSEYGLVLVRNYGRADVLVGARAR